MPAESIVIVGTSVRSAAQSAVRSGLSPLAVDQFADTDLRSCCPAVRVTDFPAGLVPAVAGLPDAPWMYTGAIENHPACIEEVCRHRTLWGNSVEQVRRVRDPWAVARALRQAGLQFPDLWAWDRDRPPPGMWLRKPFRSGGGRGLRLLFVPDVARGSPTRVRIRGEVHRWGFRECDSGSFYLQRRVAGQSYGAVYLGNGRQSRLLGITQQLVGRRWAGARRFWYSGSVGPIAFGPEQRRHFERLGDCLVREFSLRGLFGVDTIVGRTGIWAIEVNPRYTASVEVLERGLSLSAIRWHAAACRDGRLPAEPPSPRGGFCGKAVLYARLPLVITPQFCAFVRRANAGNVWPHVADMPAEGTQLLPGQPIVSVFAAGASLTQARRSLRRRAAALYLRLGDPAVG